MEISSFSTTAYTDFSMGALCSEHCKYRSNNSHVTSNVQKLTGDSLLGEEAHDLWQSTQSRSDVRVVDPSTIDESS